MVSRTGAADTHSCCLIRGRELGGRDTVSGTPMLLIGSYRKREDHLQMIIDIAIKELTEHQALELEKRILRISDATYNVARLDDFKNLTDICIEVLS